jgi:23S rRNA maturation mini-RNase III
MRMKYAAVVLFLILSSIRPSISGDALYEAIAHEYIVDAFQCSETALRQYALSSSETAEKVADAAFEKCSDKWSKYAEFSGKSMDSSATLKQAQANCEKMRGSECPSALPGSLYLIQAAKRTFLYKAVTEVFDIRAEAKKE